MFVCVRALYGKNANNVALFTKSNEKNQEQTSETRSRNPEGRRRSNLKVAEKNELQKNGLTCECARAMERDREQRAQCNSIFSIG